MAAVLLVGCGASLDDGLAGAEGRATGTTALGAAPVATEPMNGDRAVSSAAPGMGTARDGGLIPTSREVVQRMASAQQSVNSAAQVPATRDSNSVAGAAAPVALPKEMRTLVEANTPGNDGYRIGAQDVLDISVFRVPELAKTVQVAEVGTINLPLIGDVSAAGRTAQQLEQDLATKWGGRYLNNPQVNVFVKEYNSQRVTVEGAVKKPGVYPYRGRISILQLIATAGGVEEVADTSQVVVFRTVSGKREVARFNIDEIKAGRAADPPIMQGDVVVIDKSMGKQMWQDLLKALPVFNVFRGFL